MRFPVIALLAFAFVGLTPSSAILTRDLVLFKPPNAEHDCNTVIDSNLSTHYRYRRMDVLDPGDTLPGRAGFTFSLVKFICFVGSLVDTRSAATTALLDFYTFAMDQLSAYPPGTEFTKSTILLRGEFLSLLIGRESDESPLTLHLVLSFLAHMIVRLEYGGYVGIYEAYLRQVRGPGMFYVKLQPNTDWLSEGVGGFSGMIGLAALGFKS